MTKQKNISSSNIQKLPSFSHTKLGFWFGAGFCLLGLIVISIAFGQAFYIAARGVRQISIPGQNNLELKKGIYFGISQNSEISESEISGLNFAITDAKGFSMPLQKVLGAGVAFMGGKKGIALFQCEAPEDDYYLLNSEYPFGKDGPKINAFLIHESVTHTRADIVVGILLFLVFCGIGITMLIKTSRALKK